MSTIKNSTPSTVKQTSKPASKPAARSTTQNKPGGEARKPQTDRFRASDEARENRETRRGRETRDGRKPGEARDADKTREGKEGDEKETKALDDKISDLEKQLAEMKNQGAQQAQQPQSGGSSGGGDQGGGDKGGAQPAQAPQAPQAAQQPMNAQGVNGLGQGGPDGELQSLAAQVLQANGGQQGGFPGMQGGMPGVNAMGGNPFQAGFRAGLGGGTAGLQGMGGNQQAKAQLAQKASQYAQQGFQPQAATRVLVQSALGYDAFQQQGQQFGQQPFGGMNNGFAMQPAMNFGGMRF